VKNVFPAVFEPLWVSHGTQIFRQYVPCGGTGVQKHTLSDFVCSPGSVKSREQPEIHSCSVYMLHSLPRLEVLPVPEPSTPHFIHLFTQCLSSTRNTCPYHCNLFSCSTVNYMWVEVKLASMSYLIILEMSIICIVQSTQICQLYFTYYLTAYVQGHLIPDLRQVAKSRLIRHHRSRCTILLPVCRLRQIDLFKLELVTWLTHKSQTN